MEKPFKRRRLWIDTPFQLRLLVRMSCYILAYACVTLHLGFLAEGIRLLNKQGGKAESLLTLYFEYLEMQKPLLFSVAVLTPIILYDLLKFSNRIAGPLYRCRRVMEEMAAGGNVPEFKPRKHDLLQELFRAFNSLIQAWNSRMASSRNGSNSSPAKAFPENGSAPEGAISVADSPREMP